MGIERAGNPDHKFQYNGKEKQTELGLNWMDYGARFYDSQLGRWHVVDALADAPEQIDLSPYQYGWNNPTNLTDPDGNCPNCATAGIGAVVGGLLGGGIEAGMQLYEHGEIKDWGAVGGATAQGAITGGVAGLTGGASLFVTTGASAGANVLGGAANNAIQGKENTVGTVGKDAVIGAGGAVLGKAASAGIDKLSPAVKGKIGETATQVKYLMKGYVSESKAVVATGGKTATGRVQNAVYDHKMVNKITGKTLTVESKFNKAGLTGNQRAAKKVLEAKGTPLTVDRTTSGQLGNTAGGVAAGSTSSQIKRNQD